MRTLTIKNAQSSRDVTVAYQLACKYEADPDIDVGKDKPTVMYHDRKVRIYKSKTGITVRYDPLSVRDLRKLKGRRFSQIEAILEDSDED